MSEHVYGFTTTEDDNYLPRVVDEATPDTDFIITTERHTIFGEGTSATLLIRKTILVLALAIPELPLAGKTLGEWLLDTAFSDLENGTESNEFTAVRVDGPSEVIAEELEQVRHEIRRIKNVKDGRLVRAKVESF
jgi:hypothetical protein